MVNIRQNRLHEELLETKEILRYKKINILRISGIINSSL